MASSSPLSHSARALSDSASSGAAASANASPAGSPAFNEELGRLTLLSYPIIAIPSMLMMMAVLYYLARTIRMLAGLKFTETFSQPGTRHES